MHQILLERKVTTSCEDDLPATLLSEFLPELEEPIAFLFRESVRSHTWPVSWKMEKHVVIPKSFPPKDKKDVRNLGLTPYLSKCLEYILLMWIWPFIAPFISLSQVGGISGCSTALAMSN